MTLPVPSRLPFIDLLRAVASNTIVLHHLAFYGPLSDTAYDTLPGLTDFLYEYGRYAVQVFFVLGGFFAARGCRDDATASLGAFAAAVWARYRRAGLPYLVAILLAVVANAVAREWAALEEAGGPASAAQLLAHAFFLHDLLDLEALSAGVWYVAIDFQLFLLVTAVWAITSPISRITMKNRSIVATALLLPLAVASVFAFNRDPDLDDVGIYFLGSYWLGMAVEWALSRRIPAWVPLLSVAVTGGALAVEWRPRLAVAIAAALVVFAAGRSGVLSTWPRSRVSDLLGRISYSLFLVHFPVFLVVAAIVTRFAPTSVPVAIAGMLGAWAASLGVAMVFHRYVESRFTRAH